MTLAQIQALTNQLVVAPGQRVEIFRIVFTYKGPARKLIAGFAIKPQTGLFGTDWNNGLNTIPTTRAFSGIINVPDSPLSKVYDTSIQALLPFAFGFSIPTPGSYALEGGGSGKINNGANDTWVWLTDFTLLEPLGQQQTPRDLMKESNLLVLDTDSGVISINTVQVTQNAEVFGVQAGYRIG